MTDLERNMLTIVSYSNIMLLAISLLLYWKYSQKNMFNKFFFFKKTIKNWWKLILKQNIKGYNFYLTNFSGFPLESWEILIFFFRQKDYFSCNSLKRDRAALVGLPPAALGPQDIPHQRTAQSEVAGALFRYIEIGAKTLKSSSTFQLPCPSVCVCDVMKHRLR